MASMGAWLKSNNYQGYNGLANGPAPYQMANPSPVAMPAALMSSAPGFTGGNTGNQQQQSGNFQGQQQQQQQGQQQQGSVRSRRAASRRSSR